MRGYCLQKESIQKAELAFDIIFMVLLAFRFPLQPTAYSLVCDHGETVKLSMSNVETVTKSNPFIPVSSCLGNIEVRIATSCLQMNLPIRMLEGGLRELVFLMIIDP